MVIVNLKGRCYIKNYNTIINLIKGNLIIIIKKIIIKKGKNL